MIDSLETSPKLRPGEFYVQKESLKIDDSFLLENAIYTLQPFPGNPEYFSLFIDDSYSCKLRYAPISTLKGGMECIRDFYIEDHCHNITANVSDGVTGTMIHSGPQSFVDCFSSKGMTHVHT